MIKAYICKTIISYITYNAVLIFTKDLWLKVVTPKKCYCKNVE